ncbi:hypothetical protein J3Q64DRAFT_1732273 [Phycomyces blakesleeanus]|uniref:Uncharacterized protein n=1 Tax=Phycomyces blakesleeanus TaxID=4837 RepID=A0ABR3B652_PHYBL
MFTITRILKQRAHANRWILLFLGITILQLLISMINLITNTRFSSPKNLGQTLAAIQLAEVLKHRLHRNIMESAWIFMFQVWRLWVGLDGIIRGDRPPVIVAGVSTIWTIAMSAIQIVISRMLINHGMNEVYPQLVMSGVLIGISAPIFIVVVMLVKNSSWTSTPDLGPDPNMKNMYNCISRFLVLSKCGIFFQFLLMLFHGVFMKDIGFQPWNWVLFIPLPILSLVFMLTGQKAIAAESSPLMIIFILYQACFLAYNSCMIWWGEGHMVYNTWIFLYTYSGVAMILCLLTLLTSIRCLANFGKGIQPFVKTGLFNGKNATDLSDGDAEMAFATAPMTLEINEKEETPNKHNNNLIVNSVIEITTNSQV